MKVFETTKKYRRPMTLVLLCFIVALSLAACNGTGSGDIDPPTTGPIETLEATGIPTESVDYSADETETIELPSSN